MPESGRTNWDVRAAVLEGRFSEMSIPDEDEFVGLPLEPLSKREICMWVVFWERMRASCWKAKGGWKLRRVKVLFLPLRRQITEPVVPDR